MKNLLLLSMLFLVLQSFSQSTHTVNFEPAGVGANWAWTMAENADNPPLEFVANPVSGGINTSATVAKFTARATGNPWALCFTDDDGEFTFDAGNAIVKIMVYKPVISNVGIKFEGMSTPVEILIPNTVINQWQELTFNFSASIGNTYDRLVIIPDFAPRAQENIIYFDNIQVPDGVVGAPSPEPTTAPPLPTQDPADVLSIYSDAYSNLPGTNFNPNWGQSTTVTVNVVIAGNNTLKYENLNYQGTEYTNQDVSGYDFLHVDFWTSNSTDLGIYLISPGAETEYVFTIVPETWVSVDIPLSYFVPPVNLANVFQFKVEGNGDIWFDNWYFWKTPSTPGSDATLSDLKVNGSTIAGFVPAVLNYTVALPGGTVIVPTVTATTTDPLAGHVVIDATSLPGTTQVVVTAQDGITTLTYNVNFTFSEPAVAAPTPTQNSANVISMFSDAYTDVPVDTWLTPWSQGTLEDVLIAGNPTKKYTNVNFIGVETTGANLIDASAMTHFHIDVWTPDANDFKIKLVDFGADGTFGGGDDTEHELTFPAPAIGTWISYDIPLADFTGLASTEHMAQLILVKAPLGTLFVDNVFYYTEVTSWTGNNGNDWHDALNWTNGIPGPVTHVTIPAGLTNYPTIDAPASCNNITLISDATGTATLVDDGYLAANGIATVQRYYPTGGTTYQEWHLISSPVSDAQAGIYSGYYMQWYQEATTTWHDVVSLTTPLTSLQGFAFYAPNDGMSFDYVGTLGNGTYVLPISATGSVPQHWNLFGNPYPSSLDWDLVAPANLANLQTGAVYYLDQATGAYVSYNGGMGGGVRYVPAGQGFFVSGAIDAAPFTVDNTMRTHMGGSNYYKTNFDNLLVLTAEGNGYVDKTYLRFDNAATAGIDKQFDAFKIMSVSNADLPLLYTQGGDKLSINVLPQTDIVSAGFKAGVPGNYTIGISEVVGMSEVILEDLVTATLTDLLNGNHTFAYDLNDPEDRFVLHFTTVGIPADYENLVNIYSSGLNIHITLPENTQGQISIFNALGQEIHASLLSNAHNIVDIKESGFYIVSVNFEGQNISKKIMIR
jgi:hypothetical protein